MNAQKTPKLDNSHKLITTGFWEECCPLGLTHLLSPHLSSGNVPLQPARASSTSPGPYSPHCFLSPSSWGSRQNTSLVQERKWTQGFKWLVLGHGVTHPVTGSWPCCPISEKVLSPYSLLTRDFRSQGTVELAIQGQSASLKLSPRWLLCCSPLQNLYLNPEAQDKRSFHTVITPAFLPVRHGRPHQYLSRPRCLAMGPLRN